MKKEDKLNKLISEEKSGWLVKAEWREANENWLDGLFETTLKIQETLKQNKYPQYKEELTEVLEQFRLILKGKNGRH